MTEESPQEPQDFTEPEDLPDPELSPLRGLASEMHEIFQELRFVGFTERVATGIVAQMIATTMGYESGGDSVSIQYDYDDDNDDYDERDEDNERGTS